MAKAPDYKFKDEMFDGRDNCPIEILDGEYKGIIFRYGKISLKETDDGNMEVNMNISIVSSPEGFNKESEQFTQIVGEIFSDIVEKNIQEEQTLEQVDLEDDVHQD
jgi:single-stranded DNA-specific DHH superfamily exonuclease